MNPALIAGEVIDTMGNDHTAGEAGKIMIKGFERLSTVALPIAIERSQVFLFLGIDAQDRVARLEKRLNERGQMAKLLAAMRRVAAGQSQASRECVVRCGGQHRQLGLADCRKSLGGSHLSTERPDAWGRLQSDL